mgnify:CR=1 FL=1
MLATGVLISWDNLATSSFFPAFASASASLAFFNEIKRLLENADYLHRALIPAIPPCLVLADRLRLQQVFDNIFANSYKYSDTAIWVRAEKVGGLLIVELEDNGGGLPAEEIFFIKEKFRFLQGQIPLRTQLLCLPPAF